MNSSDIYCEKILAGKLQITVIRETTNVLAFKHTQPFWETHIVVIPKKHIESLTTLGLADQAVLLELVCIASEICSEVEAVQGGCRLSTNVGSYQSSKHLHFYIHAGKRMRDEDGSPIGGDH